MTDRNAPNQHPTRPLKAYNNPEFLNSRDARAIRILCEYSEPMSRFTRLNVRDTVVFFGSARTLPRDVAQEKLTAIEARVSGATGKTEETDKALRAARRDVEMSRYYEEARELAHRLTEWSISIPNNVNRFAICSGGGPGIMEAANRGAMEAGGPSIGLNISLPMEQHPNAYQTPELSFEFHYFFVRKFWFLYLARALVAFPGGFGTLDELFELLTLVQTEKTTQEIPIVMYGGAFWNKVLDFDVMADYGVIDPRDLELFRVFDDVDSTFEFLRDQLTEKFLRAGDNGLAGPNGATLRQ